MDVGVSVNKLTMAGLQYGPSGEEETIVEDPAVLGAGRLVLCMAMDERCQY